MESQTKNCQNCKKDFTIESEDFAFYEKIKVPPPTFCPGCRLQRRLSFINFINLYKRACDRCGKESVSKYPPGAPLVTYCLDCYYSGDWDPITFGREYDFSKPFFEQFKELLARTPIITLDLELTAAQSSPFTNHAANIKDCYLVFFALDSEQCMYGFYLHKNRSLLDSSSAMQCERCYDSSNIFKDNGCIGVRNTNESIDCIFLRDSINCQNCFASANLRNKKYYIFNKPYSKEEYFKEIQRWDLGSYKTYTELRQRAVEHWKQFPPKPYWNDLSVDSTGNYVFESKNCKECYEVVKTEDSKYVMMTIGNPTKDCYDITGWGDNLTNSYEAYIGSNVTNARFYFESNIGDLQGGEYGILSGGRNLFGCVSIMNGEYYILNKRYSKEEFEVLRNKIVVHMNEMPYVDKNGCVYRYGEFFPIEISWLSYNETLAQTFFPLTKEQAIARGYRWHDTISAKHEPTILAKDMPDHIKDAHEDILKEKIGCSTCVRVYRIIPDELQFLKSMNLPLPRRCPTCRLEERIANWAKNLTLVTRSCSECKQQFRTRYTTEEAPRILCKECYIREVV